MVARSFILIVLLLSSPDARADKVQITPPALDGPQGYAGSPLAPGLDQPERRFTGFTVDDRPPAGFWATGLTPLAAAVPPKEPRPAANDPRRSLGAVGSATPYASGGLGCGDGTAAKAGPDGQRIAYKVGAGVLLPAPASGNLDIGYRFCSTADLREIEAPGAATAGKSHRLHIGYRMRF